MRKGQVQGPSRARQVSLLPAGAYVALTAAAAFGAFGKLDFNSAPGAAAFWLNRAYGWWAAITLVLLQIGLGRVLGRRGLLARCAEPGLTGYLVLFTIGSFASYLLLTLLSLLGVLGGVGVPVFVGVDVFVLVGTAVEVGVGVEVAVEEEVGVGVKDSVGVGVGASSVVNVSSPDWPRLFEAS